MFDQSAPNDASLSAAVARQRELIVGWAEEVVRDKQDVKQLRTGRGAPPVRVAWGKPGAERGVDPSTLPLLLPLPLPSFAD